MQNVPKFGAKVNQPNEEEAKQAVDKLKEFLYRKCARKRTVGIVNFSQVVEVSSQAKGMDFINMEGRIFISYQEALFQICRGVLSCEIPLASLIEYSSAPLSTFVFHSYLRRRGTHFQLSRAQVESRETPYKRRATEPPQYTKVYTSSDTIDINSETVGIVESSSIQILKLNAIDMNFNA